VKGDPPKEVKALVKVREKSLELLVQRLQVDRDAELVALVRSILEEVRVRDIVDLWEPREAALTYWILMLTGVNQPDEMQLAKDLLSWQAFFSKDSARVLCVQSSERDSFRCCSAAFQVHDCPTLVMGDAPDMHSYLKIEADLLKSLIAMPGELQRFLARLHALVQNGRSLEDLRDLMAAEGFWRGLKLVYKEVKGLISITLSPG
jgi:hypothetical protein